MSPRDRLAELANLLDLKRSHQRLSGDRVVAVAAPHGRITASGDDVILHLNFEVLSESERAIGRDLVDAGLISTSPAGQLVLLRQPADCEITDLRWLIGLHGRHGVPA
jgi:hypothetical protein